MSIVSAESEHNTEINTVPRLEKVASEQAQRKTHLWRANFCCRQASKDTRERYSTRNICLGQTEGRNSLEASYFTKLRNRALTSVEGEPLVVLAVELDAVVFLALRLTEVHFAFGTVLEKQRGVMKTHREMCGHKGTGVVRLPQELKEM